MTQAVTDKLRIRRKRRGAFLLFSLSAFGLAVAVFLLSIFEYRSETQLVNGPVFMILCGMLACTLVAPLAYLFIRRRFVFFHPLVYPVVMYLFPVFVLGSLRLASPLPPSWVLLLIPDPVRYLNLALIYIIIGFAGLTVGFALPVGSRLGNAVARHLPRWDWSPSAARLPGLILFAVGTIVTFYGYVVGVLGYQVRETPLLAGGTLSAFTLLGTMGAFILWHSYFRRDRSKLEFWTPTLVLLVGQIITNGMLSGSRSTLLVGVLVIFAAYHFAGGRLTPRMLFPVIAIGVLATLFGFAAGTAFRDIKGSETAVSFGETLDVASMTASHIADLGVGGTLDFAVDSFLQRLENLSSFAVILSNYERLRPLEEQYGLAGNIWTYTWTALIPRFVWPDKPLISDARAVGALYFNFPTNSFAMTVFGDLLRNFGPIGIPLGMMLLGFMLRVLWSMFIRPGPVPAWHAATYYLLLTNVNYESFYGTIIPSWVRIAFVCFLGGLFANAVARASDGSRSRLERLVPLPKAAK